MSYANSYTRRPQYSNVGYGQNYGQNYGRDHGQNYGRDQGQNHSRDYGQNYGRDYGQNYGRDYGHNNGTGYDPNHHYNRQQPSTYVPRRRNSYNNYPASQVIYSTGTPQYVTGGRDYSRAHYGYSRHSPNVVVAGSHSLGRQATPYVSTGTSARYRAEGHRGQSIPVVAGVPYRDEGIPLSTRIRRLFGLGPRRSSTHVGKTVHVKRWGFGRHGYHVNRQYTTANYSGHGSQSTVYTL